MIQFITMREALLRDIADLKRERDEARAWSARWKNAAKDWRRMFRDLRDAATEILAKHEDRYFSTLKERDKAAEDATNYFARLVEVERERDEAIAARKASAADWLGQVEQANSRVCRALQQVALAERERDEAREDLLAARRHCSLQNEVIEYLRDQLCADKCRDKAAADGGWGNI